MQLAIAQLNQVVGDLPANARRILDAAAQARAAGAALVVTPELSLCGYPPEDLILRPAFLDACASELAALAAQVTAGVLLVGFPGAARRPAPQRDGGHPRRPRRAGLSQAVPAQLHGFR